MGRLSQSLIAGGMVAAIAGMMMKRKSNSNMMNRMMNSAINMMGSLGAFRLMSKTRYFKNMVKMR